MRIFLLFIFVSTNPYFNSAPIVGLYLSVFLFGSIIELINFVFPVSLYPSIIMLRLYTFVFVPKSKYQRF